MPEGSLCSPRLERGRGPRSVPFQRARARPSAGGGAPGLKTSAGVGRRDLFRPSTNAGADRLPRLFRSWDQEERAATAPVRERRHPGERAAPARSGRSPRGRVSSWCFGGPEPFRRGFLWARRRAGVRCSDPTGVVMASQRRKCTSGHPNLPRRSARTLRVGGVPWQNVLGAFGSQNPALLAHKARPVHLDSAYRASVRA